MKLRLILTSIALTACGSIELEGQPSAQEDGTKAATSNGSEPSEQASQLQGEGAAEDAPEHEPVIATLLALSKRLDLEIATCAGFGDEAKALHEAMEALRAAKADKQSAREQLEPLHEALEAKRAESEEALAGCLEQSRESKIAVTLNGLTQSCFDKPDLSGESDGDRPGKLPPPPSDGLTPPGAERGPGDRQGPGKGHGHGGGPGRERGPEMPDGSMAGPHGERPPMPHVRLPPKEAAKFDSDECKAALSEAQGVDG
jgi:hypothetical protein